ncbi:MAG: NmrA family NAD(P)-binding protein [Propionicimonas sp.]
MSGGDSLDRSRSSPVQSSTCDASAPSPARVSSPPSDRIRKGIDVVISAVQGGQDIIVDGQIALARAAEASGVRRCIPSDFALDIWAAPEGAPMFALRREADAVIDGLGLEVLHVLNGAFMDMTLDPRTAGVVDLDKGTGNYYADVTPTSLSVYLQRAIGSVPSRSRGLGS